MTRFIPCLLLAVVGLAVPAAPRAAQSYDNCTGFIDSLPASITAQGTWCLRKHLYTSQASGPAISVLADNVTIDCNDHRLSGFGALDSTEAVGINTGPSRAGATVRNCRVQGFKYGVVLHGTRHLVERNRFDGNTFTGIHVSGTRLLIRHNLVTDTGGRPNAGFAYAIYAGQGRVEGNTISGVSPDSDAANTKFPVGIRLAQGLVDGNRISGLVAAGPAGKGAGILFTGVGVARANVLTEESVLPSDGISSPALNSCLAHDNEIHGYLTPIFKCLVSGNATQ